MSIIVLLFLGCAVYCLWKGAKFVAVCLLLWFLFAGGCGRRNRYHEPEIPAEMHVAAPLPRVDANYYEAIMSGEISHDSGW